MLPRVLQGKKHYRRDILKQLKNTPLTDPLLRKWTCWVCLLLVRECLKTFTDTNVINFAKVGIKFSADIIVARLARRKMWMVKQNTSITSSTQS